MTTLDELEARLQALLEVQLLKYLPGYRAEDGVYQQLAVAMHNSLKEQDGKSFAPNVYVVIAHPTTLVRWRTSPNLINELAEGLKTAGEEAWYLFLVPPTVTTAADKNITVGETHIIASFSDGNLAETRGTPSGASEVPAADAIPPNAFMIQGGVKIIPLDRPVINIGRRLDNQVVIDDPRVSRAHAQVRVTKGRFVLFDLNSSGGTYINGQQINQSVLYPGDVISLAGVTLIFGQDLPVDRNQDRAKTEPKPVISGDRLTAIFNRSEDGIDGEDPQK